MPEREDTYTEVADTLLPIGDAAKMLGVTVATVRRWDAAGHIAATRTPGGQRRFRLSEVQRLRRGAASADDAARASRTQTTEAHTLHR